MNVNTETRCFALLFLAVVAAAGCGGPYSTSGTPDDEAMRRLQWENDHSNANVLPDEAAKRYFLPKSYYDPNRPPGKGIRDYFPGMDRIVVSADWSPESGDDPPLSVPVFQLMDTALDPSLFEFRVETSPLQTNRQILGRNTWMLWCGGNEGFWDWLANYSFGFIDLLRLIDSRERAQRFDEGGLINEPQMMQSGSPDQFGVWLDVPIDKERRKWRDAYLKKTFALIEKGQHKSQRGLDVNRQTSLAGYEAKPYEGSGEESYSQGEDGTEYDYESDSKYPPPDIYGLSSGVVGLRLFPNPYFEAEARKKWVAKRYYDRQDKDYWDDPQLVRPYRVGVTCAFCHASFHPLKPPRDVTNPKWDNISGNIGAQYLRIRKAFGNLLEPDNFVYHLLDSQPPGTIDTSLIASDNINNPNTMNSVFNLPQRALLSLRNPKESISTNSAKQPSLWDYRKNDEFEPQGYYPDPVPQAYLDLLTAQDLAQEAADANSHPPRRVPRILLDGSDSIGAWGALARVYLNIGTYWEQWQRLHRTVIGFEEQKAFTIVDCEQHSLYWHATQDRVAALRDYFLKISPSMPLLSTAGGGERAKPIDEAALQQQASREGGDFARLLAAAKARHVDVGKLQQGRKVFARNCIVCHSSIQPESSAVTFFADDAERDAYHKKYEDLIEAREKYRENDAETSPGEFWEHDPARWLGDARYLEWAEEAVELPEFWRLNYLSTDYRVPINLVKTNAGRAMATNAIDKNMWDDFASESYQNLPSVGAIEYFDPYAGPDGKLATFSPRHKVREDQDHDGDGRDGDGPYGEESDDRIPRGGGGPGFYRVPTLVSIWATAPLLHNNSLGTFNNDPSIDGRLEAFDDAIRKLLWPERRLEGSSYNGATPDRLKRDRGLIWRTPQETYLEISGSRVPNLIGPEISAVMAISERHPWLGELRPLWLPSGILLLAAFLFLVLDSEKWRRVVGWLALLLSALVLLCALWSDTAWLSWIYPLPLFAVLLAGVGVIFITIDRPKQLRYAAWALLIVGAFGFVLYLANVDWRWWQLITSAVSITSLSAFLIAGGVLLWLTSAAKEWRTRLGRILLVVAAVGLLVYGYNVNVGGSTMSATIGPVWIYLLLIVAAALVLLTPDREELTRYVGYSALVLSLLLGGLAYFFAGELGNIRLGPIPKGTPVNLLANLNPDAERGELLRALKVTIGTLGEIESKHLNEEDAQQLLRAKVAPALMQVSKCPDFVMDHGHYYEWFDDMTDDDKEALIELLKTF